MPTFFSKVFRAREAGKKNLGNTSNEPRPEDLDPWLRTEVTPYEVQELLSVCSAEVKSRGLMTPFFLLPFRPEGDASGSKIFIRKFFQRNSTLRGATLQQELRLTEPVVLCSILKWCWSRLPGGVVTWEVYEFFRVGEQDCSMARDAFPTFIPMAVNEDKARSQVIFDFFDLLSAVAAHGKHNGLGGIKLSRLAGWWAFEHQDNGWGFEGGYVSWSRAADATCHLFFAYLRSLSPDPSKGGGGVPMLPTSLRALLASTDYPPVEPPSLQNQGVRVALTVETVSPSPFALLRRAKRFNYRDDDLPLTIFRKYEDPIQGLSEECKRVLKCISNTNTVTSTLSDFKISTSLRDSEREPSWSRFQDMGFTNLLDESSNDEKESEEMVVGDEDALSSRRIGSPASDDLGVDLARPATPSWADFMASGFAADGQNKSSPAPLLLPPDKQLPLLDSQSFRVMSAASQRRAEDNLDPGELAGVHHLVIDDAFWWVWISSLAGEEVAGRKAVFGRCVLVETVVENGRWFVVEEKIKGAITDEEAALLASKEKKKRGRTLTKLTRRKSVSSKQSLPLQPPSLPPFDASYSGSRTALAPDQRAKIQTAAAQLKARDQKKDNATPVRSPTTRTNSTFTLQPLIVNEATSALKWASKYDRDAIRDDYLKSGPAKPQEETTTTEEKPLPAAPTSDPSTPKQSAFEHQKMSSVDMFSVSATTPPTAPTKTTEQITMKPVSPLVPPPGTPIPERKAPTPSPPTPSSPGPRSDTPKSNRSSIDFKTQQAGKSSRFKRFFGTKKETSNPVVGKTPSRSNTPSEPQGLAVPAKEEGLTRKLSMVRKKDGQGHGKPAPLVAAPAVKDTTNGSPVSPLSDKHVEAGMPAPNVEDHPALAAEKRETRPEMSRESSDASSGAKREAEKTFANFSQGPLLDQPAFVPEESPEISVDGSEDEDSDPLPSQPMQKPAPQLASRGFVGPPPAFSKPQVQAGPGPRGPGSNYPRNPGSPQQGPGPRGPPNRGPQGNPMSPPRGPPGQMRPPQQGPGYAPGPGPRGQGLPGPGGPGQFRPQQQFNIQTRDQNRQPGRIPAYRGPAASGERIDIESDSDMDATSPVNPIKKAESRDSDRWREIRERAAERAKNGQYSSGAPVSRVRDTSRAESADEGETSGEETIESRVARIKARVAELTGNVDGPMAGAR
ncbi:hypothetical protein BJ508DRAFT_301708 [Ascobolus immersus RN42]|uniref:Meiotically up-regulated protein Msb1/Mug8 domain-containing protein n=1 Tax=Ascobolus immersus RN42 TaxID=1160509 RepID=A0A3N4IL87_ASCIM|nr:hypothetical protein BJ508DRAFT_301708 [Ascobolus immersus RN42]